MENQEELWLPVPEYEGLYEVSNWGRVKSIRRKGSKGGLLSFRIKDGYYAIKLVKNNNSRNITVHQVVTMAFLGHKPNSWKIHIDHIDGNKLNNNVSNLQIVTHRENLSKCHRVRGRNKTSRFVGVYSSKDMSKWRARVQIDKYQIHLGLFPNEDVAREFYLLACDNIDRYDGDNAKFRNLIKDLYQKEKESV